MDSESTDLMQGGFDDNTGRKTMGLLLLIVIVFLLLGGAGFGLHGTLGTVLIVFALLWLFGGLGYHGSRSGWYGGRRGN
jgi:hypothetical protein